MTVEGERDGVVVAMALSDTALQPGERVWATVTVRNTGHEPARWKSNACKYPASVRTELTALRSVGEPPDDRIAAFKYSLVIGATREEFTPGRVVTGETHGLCDDVGLVNDLAPGETLRHRAAWDMRFGCESFARPGTARVVAAFPFYDRAQARMGDGDDPLAVATDVRLEGPDPGTLTPSEVVAAAIADPQAASWLAERPNARLRGDLGTEEGVRKLFAYRFVPDGEEFLEIRVHPQTGAILAIDAD